MKLVIVESPTKAKTLSKYLDKDYKIKASKGHIRDLPKKKLGVDVENNYMPEYMIPDKAKKVITDLNKTAKDADGIVLATDPDREGEAIAWHLQEILKEKAKKKAGDFERVVFHELTKPAVAEAFEHPSKLDMNLVDAQQARRVLDRLVGYNLSPLLWKKVRYGLSAGRVQSVAVRLIVERERERDAFDPEEYWSFDGVFESEDKKVFEASLVEIKGKKVEVDNEKDANSIKGALEKDSFKVVEIKKSERKRNPTAPFRTSTLQQNAANVYGFAARKTMSAAQKLFEKGLITYHRTDAVNLSPQFVESARKFAEEKFGKEYLPEKANEYSTNSRNAQEAHEAIRPTDINQTPKKQDLTTDEQKIYTLIWKRALESQMLPAIYDQTAINILSDSEYKFRANGSIIKFDGWLTVERFLGFDNALNGIKELPEIEENAVLVLNELKMEQHFTQPPARYSDASLIKKLEELGIGRPSTYAPTISTILSRRYILKEGRYFIPEAVAYVVTDLLVEHFPQVVGYEFTADMEESLDKVATEGKDWTDILKDFYPEFAKTLEEKDKVLKKQEVTMLEETDQKCPECGKPLQIKLGKYGKFLSCSGFPDCEYAAPIEDKDNDGNPDIVKQDFGECPNCDDGIFVLKEGRFGKFLACSNYPKCKTTKTYLDKIGMKCPDCSDGEIIVKKAKGRTFYGCSNYPECKYSSWKNPLEDQDSPVDEVAASTEDSADSSGSSVTSIASA